MSMKWIAAAGAVVLIAGAAWYLRDGVATEEVQEVGGKGVVVPLEVAAAREKPKPESASPLESTGEAQRTVQASEPSSPPSAPSLHGFVFVDGTRRAPSDLKITRLADKARRSAEASVDASSASWALSPLGGSAGTLWITSSSTVLAQIPVPTELWEKGGEFDLQLSSGRTLTLTFLDKETKEPLPNLEFVLENSIETARGNGRVSTRGEEFMHKTDAQGRAVLKGIPLTGSISVTVDTSKRERDMVMQDGKTMHARLSREPDWQTWLKKEQPAQLEQTIFVSVPLGEACATGQVPPWAVALAGNPESVRVLARETTNESPQARGMAFLISQDDHGGFELCVEAPGKYAVWLENGQSRQRLSAETVLDVVRPGAQDPITFREIQGKKVTLRFVHVPDHGQLQAWTDGRNGTASSGTMNCQGADFTHDFTLAGDERIQLSLRLDSSKDAKSGWTMQVRVDNEHEITVDLGGCERSVRIECAELGELAAESWISFMRCEAGEAGLDQTIIVHCNAGRGVSPVHIPNGRWLYSYDDRKQLAAMGVVDVTTAAQPGEELLLRPKLRLAPREEFAGSVRFEEVDGISLAKWPEKFRTLSVKDPGERIAVPIDAKYVTLEGK